MFRNEVIDRYMRCIMQNFKINAQICIYSLTDSHVLTSVDLLPFNIKFFDRLTCLSTVML